MSVVHPLSAIVSGFQSVGIQFFDAAGKNPMDIVHIRSKPFLLAFPIVGFLWVGVVEIAAYPTVWPSGEFFPLQRIAQFLLDGFLLSCEETEERLGPGASDVEFGFYPVEASVHGRTNIKLASPDRVRYP